MHYGIRMTEVNEWIGLIDRMREEKRKRRGDALKTQQESH
jgi:hypothetical protein